jgi:hydroxyacyl-ACP dehydratase HTD2-like protein with hotdog domain
MAINKPIIDAGPTYTRERVQTVVLKHTNTVPPNSAILVKDGVLTSESQLALREGQMLAYRDSAAADNGFVLMYVVVTINSALTWVPVATGASYSNSYTGQKWDPNASFYSNLVP